VEIVVVVLHHGFVESRLLLWAVSLPEADAGAGAEWKIEAELSDVKVLKEITVLFECVAFLVVGEHALFVCANRTLSIETEHST